MYFDGSYYLGVDLNEFMRKKMKIPLATLFVMQAS